jgi:small subunit ribosomal protein S11
MTTKKIKHAHMYVTSTFNNTIISFAKPNGEVFCWQSTGSCGFKGARKSTPYASTVATQNVLQTAQEKFGVQEIDVFIKGPGPGRDAALRVLRAANINIGKIADVTPMPHNGCRPRKPRRV